MVELMIELHDERSDELILEVEDPERTVAVLRSNLVATT